MLLMSAANLHAELYYWVDENGVKHYTQTPPSDGQAVNKLDEIPHNEQADRQNEEEYLRWREEESRRAEEAARQAQEKQKAESEQKKLEEERRKAEEEKALQEAEKQRQEELERLREKHYHNKPQPTPLPK
jgi:hypothetical protein